MPDKRTYRNSLVFALIDGNRLDEALKGGNIFRLYFILVKKCDIILRICVLTSQPEVMGFMEIT